MDPNALHPVTERTIDGLAPPPTAYFDELSNNPLDDRAHQRHIAMAAPYFSAFDARKAERQRVIRKKCEMLQGGPIVVSTFNWGFRHLVENWTASCDRNGIDCRAFSLLFPMDEGADAFARDLGLQTFFDGASYGKLPTEACKAFGDDDFRKCLFAKVATTQDMLEIGADVLRQDVDLAWLHDPRSYLAERADRENIDFLFMDDGPNKHHWPLHFNSGFIFIRNSSFARFAWNLVFSNYPRILFDGGEQRTINTIMSYLSDRGVRCDRLAEQVFVNGHVLCEALDKGTPLPTTSAVVHASWTDNLALKLDRLKQFGLWYL